MKPIYYIFFLLIFNFIPVSTSTAVDIDSSSPFIYPEFSKRISMDFQNASLVDVLKIFSQQSNLNLITAESVENLKVTVYLDNVPVEEALEQILRANNLTYEINPGSGIYIVKPMQRPNSELSTRVYHLKHASVDSSKIRTLISVTAEGGGGGGGSEGIIEAVKSVLTSQGKLTEDARTNSLIITDIATNFPNIEQAISRLDIPVPQVLIEVEMLEVAQSITDKVGIEWSGVFMTFEGGAKENVFPFDGSVPLIEDPGPINYGADRITASTLDASGLTATLRFLKSQTDTKNLARPRILTLNNQAAEIKITTNEAISIQQSTQSSENIAYQTFDAERVETGVSLVVTPQANIESNVITMAVQPKVIIAKTGSDFGVGQPLKDPEERSAKAILKVKNGDTVVIGGLVREDTTNVHTKIPILGDIPLLGRLFKYDNLSTSERELLIFLTPHIVVDNEKRSLAAQESKKLIREQYAP
ncbi:MAG: secretin N-terminal domain-containing protein [Candidatus Omnitrophota bacterium]